MTTRPPTASPDVPAAESYEERLSRARALLGTPEEEQGVRELEALERELKDALARRPDDADAHHLLGSLYFFRGRDDEARPELDRALELAPERAEFHYMKGAWLMEKEEITDAAAEFAQAAALDPTLGHAWALLGDALMRIEEYTRAKVALGRALAVEPRTPKDRVHVGRLLWELDEPEIALAAFEDAVHRDPDDFVALCNAGQLLQLLDDPERALGYFQAAQAMDPDDWRVRAKLVQLHQALGDLEERDAHLAGLRQLRQDGKVDSDAFIREQFEEEGQPVIVYEHFELQGDQPVKYRFELLDEDGELSGHRLSLGSYERTDQIAQEMQGTPGARKFHLDRYTPEGEHETIAFFDGEPTYEQAREVVVQLIRGEPEPEAGEVPPAEG